MKTVFLFKTDEGTSTQFLSEIIFRLWWGEGVLSQNGFHCRIICHDDIPVNCVFSRHLKAKKKKKDLDMTLFFQPLMLKIVQGWSKDL